MLEKFNLSGKTVLITGAAGLLGKEHAEALLEVNSSLVLTDIDQKKLLNLKDHLYKKYDSKKIHIFKMDVSDPDSVNNVSNKLDNLNIFVDILINNASIDAKFDNGNLSTGTRLENFSLKQWEKEISVGLTGCFLCCKVFGTKMAKSSKNGVIINIASDLSVISPDQRLYLDESIPEDEQKVKPITYSVIKSALVGMTKYLSTYWIDGSVRVNSLSPGGIFNNQDEEFVKRISKLIPLGRMAATDEYRSAIQFLCSDASSYLNGQNIVMDGGRSVW